MTKTTSPYHSLKTHFTKIAHLEHTHAMLSWDEASMMPAGSGLGRAEAMATLSATIHELKSATQVGEWLAASSAGLSEFDAANLREMRTQHKRATALTNDFVTRKSLAISQSEQAWRKLRGENNWQDFLPLLDRVVELTREEAQLLAEQGGHACAYDALLDIYEPKMTSAWIDPIFKELRAFIPDLLKSIHGHAQKSAINLQGTYPIAEQKRLAETLMSCLGFDFNRGRLDTSHHPFCGGVADDVRITTRYDEADFFPAMMGVIHETGHALYEQGLPKAWRHQPVGLALGMMIHESQSLFWEMQIARSRAFFTFYAPLIRQAMGPFAQDTSQWTDENLWQESIKVRPGYIRVDADEVSYPLHIILRYEIERDLISGLIQTKDLPEVWDAKMQAYLGLSTKDNYCDGVMQDVHWPAGLFGYFPCYSLGAMAAAQLFQSMSQAVPNISDLLAQGNVTPVLNWLRSAIHEQGRCLTAENLLERACGKKLTAEAFIQHLKSRYLAE